MRGHLLRFLPNFIGRGRVEAGKSRVKKLGAEIEEMSPVEAAYITMTVLHQKIYNSEFQLTREERNRVWIEKHSGKAADQVKQAGPQSSSGEATERQREMAEVLSRAAASFSFKELLSLPDKVLDTLKVQR